MNDFSHPVLAWIWQTTWQSILLAAAVALVTWGFRRWLSPQSRQLLWMLVFVRMLMPMLPGSGTSIFRLFSRPKPMVVETKSVPVVGPMVVNSIVSKPADILRPADSYLSSSDVCALVAWIAGAIGMLVYAMFGAARMSKRVGRGAVCKDEAILRIVQGSCDQLRLRVPIVVMTDLVFAPAVMGVIRPRLLLPTEILRRVKSDSLRAIVLHELEHLRRGHLIVDWALLVIRAIHWFNPAAWWAQRQIRITRELICDRAVVRRLGEENAMSYGNVLLDFAEKLGAAGRGTPATAFLGQKGTLRQRVEAIAGFRTHCHITGLGVLLAGVIGLLFMTTPRLETSAIAADPPPPTRQAAGATRPTTSDIAVLNALEKKLPEVRFDQTAIRDAIDLLHDVSQQQIVVDWNALELAGIDRGWPITAQLHNEPLSKVLHTILDSVDDGRGHLSFYLKDAVIHVTTQDEIDRMVDTRIYDVRDLMAVAPKDEKLRADFTNDILAMIEESVATKTWQDRGGKLASLRYLDGQLIVTQSQENQQQVERLIRQLKETRGLKINLEFRVFELPSDKAAELAKRFSNGAIGAVVLSDEKTAELLKSLLEIQGASLVCSPTILASNEQAAEFRSEGTVSTKLVTRAGIATDSTSINLSVEASFEIVLDDKSGKIQRMAVPRTSLTIPDGRHALITRPEVSLIQRNADKTETTMYGPDNGKTIWVLIHPLLIVH